jgi:hypothetical protein
VGPSIIFSVLFPNKISMETVTEGGASRSRRTSLPPGVGLIPEAVTEYEAGYRLETLY